MTDLPYMPLHIGRLQRSRAWLMCKREPALAFYMINLWCRAWAETPAGSIDNDDEMLADAAMCDPLDWPSVKEKVLRGWRERAGRLTHPVIEELAKEVEAKRGRWRKNAKTYRKKRLEHDVTDDAAMTSPMTCDDVTNDVTDDPGMTSPVKVREGKVREENPPLIPPAGGTTKDAARGSRLAADWNPGKEGAEFARKLGIDPKPEWERFRDYWNAKPGAAGRKLDWMGTWRNWCRTAAERQGTKPQASGGYVPTELSSAL